MISNSINLHSPRDNSEKLTGDISDANEELFSTESAEFAIYASASLSQLEKLSGNTSLSSIYSDIAQERTKVSGSSLANLTQDAEQLTSKLEKSTQFQPIVSREGIPDKPLNVSSNPTHTPPTSQSEQLQLGKLEKGATQPQTQQLSLPIPNMNQVIKTQKGEASLQANLVTSQLIQATTQITEGETNHLAITTANRTHAAVSQWGPVPVTTNAPLAMQAQEILTPLREQLRFQIDQKIKQAEIRLDPPSLGKVELNIRLDGDRLHIQMHAANASVRDSLLMGLDRLREELAMDHGGLIDLDISQGDKREHQDERHAVNISNSQVDLIELETEQQDQQNNQIDLLA
ncbi:hypothetical protein FM037_00290 [Shewanella psychropiezotolerans]|uniref:Flagellar hook-length control protein-like C-terminal domain-containing protein n=1 Tax=Shewanella psychropiezotolerans TaxID=2593655 RepID=A0ABX5WUS4_9GAMM|nr:flagellar hook-length control protein FliK [Shewanella psychropiezotolerans]QDO81937.1 hypothetical protein FM037_00290 [Shewanella psychropiezotolerans]